MFWHHSHLAQALDRWAALSWRGVQPRRRLDLADWQADWRDNLQLLRRFATSAHYGQPQTFAGHAALENSMRWEAAAQAASNQLLKALDRGLAGAALRLMYRDVVAVWRDLAEVLRHAQDSLHAAGVDQQVGVPIRADTQQYEFALQLLALGVLLDAQDEIPGIVEHLLHFRTDRLLDYLSAQALGLEEASEQTFHPRPFGQLAAFFEQLGEPSPEPLAAYLDEQYRCFFLLSPRQQKSTRRLIGPQAWGYWALEVSALTVLYGWDDALLRSSPHYLADLVDFARGEMSHGEG